MVHGDVVHNRSLPGPLSVKMTIVPKEGSHLQGPPEVSHTVDSTKFLCGTFYMTSYLITHMAFNTIQQILVQRFAV